MTNFNADISNTNDFKSFKYKAKLLENTVAQPAPNAANGIIKNATIAVPLKYLSNFWKSLKILTINCKVELKLKWIKYCVLSAGVTLSARYNQKLSKILSKGFERSIYWNEYKTKSENKNITNEFRYFLESNFVGVNTLFVLVYSNQDDNAKIRKYYLPKGIMKNYNVIINGKNLITRELIQI